MDTTENAPVILHAQDPLELLAYLPYRLGFWPEESAVFFSLRPDAPAAGARLRWRPGLVARVDLPDLADTAPHGGGQLRTDMLRHLRADGADLVFLVLYTSEPVRPGNRDGGPAATVAQWWLESGIDADAGRIWLVCGDTYRCLECPVQPCCPSGGHPLRRITESRIGAEMVFHGMTYAASRDDLLPQVQVDRQRRTVAVRAAARWRRSRDTTGAGRAAWLTAMAAKWDQALVSAAPVAKISGRDLGALLVALEDVAVRDAVLLSAVCGKPVLHSLGSGGQDLLEQVFSPAGSPPQREVVARATDLLHQLVAVAARGRTAPVWAVLAWLAWYEGNGALADLCLQRGLAEDPTHRLGQLIRRAVDHGIPPGWARSVPAA